MRSKLLFQEPPRRVLELALLVSPADPVLEGDVGPLRARVLGSEEGNVRRKENRRVEQDELRDELRRACRQLERKPPAERMPDKERGLSAHGLDGRLQVSIDVPGRLVARGAVTEQVRCEHVEIGKRLGKLGEARSMSRDTVKADHSRGARIAPLVEGERSQGTES
jgi:hypothetical protein